MSEAATETTTAETEATATTAESTTDNATETQTETTKPTETVDFWKQKAREQEKRAKANAAAAEQLAEIEESKKTDLEKANGRTTAAESERDTAKAEALRLRTAVKHGISLEDADLFLTGTDEETLTAQAERLSAREADRKKSNNRVPKEGTSTTSGTTDEETAREYARSLFGGD